MPQPAASGAPTAVCPICGEYPEQRSCFRCIRCNRDWICLRHRDAELRWCEDCAATERLRREREAFAAEQKRREEEHRDSLEKARRDAEVERRRAEEARRRADELSRREEERRRDEEARLQADNARRKSPEPVRREDSPPEQPSVRLIGDGMVWSNLPKQKLMPAICQTLQSYGAKDVAVDPQAQAVKGKTGFNWQSIGQVITVTVAQLPDGFSATIASRPKPPQLADGGRGVQDAREIAALLVKCLQSVR
jgi:hypothetical protein